MLLGMDGEQLSAVDCVIHHSLFTKQRLLFGGDSIITRDEYQALPLATDYLPSAMPPFAYLRRSAYT